MTGKMVMIIIIIIDIMFMMVIIVSIAYKIYQAMIMNIDHAGHAQYQPGAVSYKIADNDNDHHGDDHDDHDHDHDDYEH